MNRKIRHIILVATAHLAALLAMADPTETAELSGSPRYLDEISVTAAKQISEKGNIESSDYTLQRPEIETRNIVNSKSLSSIVPNLYIPDYGSRVTSTIYARAIGARIDQPVLGLNSDNIPILTKDNYDFDIMDIESIEVIRGPQSTLYGRNTMGGVINIATLSPLSFQGTRLMLEYGNANSIKAGAASYQMLSDKFGIGGNIHYVHSDGFFTNEYNGEKCDKENAIRTSLKLAWQPTQSVTVENAASASVVRQGGYAYEFVETEQINYNDTCFYRRNSLLDGLTVRYNAERFSIMSITSYQYIDDNMTLDQDFLPQPYFTLTQKRKEHAATQDLIVKSRQSDKFSWIGGMFGFYKHSDTDAPVTFKDYGIANLIESHWNEMNNKYPLRWDTRQFLLGSNFKTPNFGTALYGEVSKDFNRLSLIAGLRFDYEKSQLEYQSDCSTNYTIYKVEDAAETVYRRKSVEIHSIGKLSQSFTQLLPKLSIAYTLSQGNSIYATAAKGYKAGGFNTQMFSDVLQQELMGEMGMGKRYNINDVVSYKPEKSRNYEIGGKFNLLDGRLLADAAAFYIDCRDQQLTVFPDGTTTGRIMTNAGKSRSIGAELALTYTPIERLTLKASYGYTNAKFRKFNDGKNDYSGKYIPYAPQNTIFASANYTLRTGNDLIRYIAFGVDLTGVGKIYWNEGNTASQNIYLLLNGNIKFSGRRYSLNLWTKNATATQYSTFYFVSIQHEFLQRGKPAQFGATLRINI